MKYLVIYLCAISLVGVFLAVFDKVRSKTGKKRVSEGTLMFIAAAGGALAMYIVMRLISHKTRHAKFMVGLPLLALFHIAAAFALIVFLPGLL